MQMLLTRHRHYMVKCLAARARNGNLQKWVGFVYLLKYLRNGRKGSSGKAFPAPIKSEVALLMYRVVNATSQQQDSTLSSISIPRCGGTSERASICRSKPFRRIVPERRCDYCARRSRVCGRC